MRRKAFTLLELITVMALTAVLMGLVVYPLIQSFDVTRAAQGFADAQNRARILIERITREVGNAAFVRDNTGEAGSVYIDVPTSAATPALVRVRDSISWRLLKVTQLRPRNPEGASLTRIRGG